MTKPESRGEAPAAAASGLRAWLGAGGWARLALALLLVAVGAGSFLLGWALREPPRLSAIAYGGERIVAINAHLANVPPGYVYLAGDSYMELYRPEALPCGREIVNGGVGGAKVGEYLRFLDLIRLQPPPSAVLLSVGLNNLLKKSKPSETSARASFRDAADTLIRRLGEGGARVVVVAIPPVAKDTAKFFDVEAIETYTNLLRDVCAKRGCEVRDVFAEARDGVFWRTKPGLAPDGIHLADLRRYYRKVYDELCR